MAETIRTKEIKNNATTFDGMKIPRIIPRMPEKHKVYAKRLIVCLL
jgi:hypothetical protein